MKHHIIFKFLAVLLCAACLLGAVGSGLGILALTEMDLYNNDAETWFADQLREKAESFAQDEMQYYATANLGGFPEGVLESLYYHSSYDYPFPVGTFNYQILDKDDNILVDKTGNRLDRSTALTFQARGTYEFFREVNPVGQPMMEIVDMTPASVTDNIPQGQNVPVYHISVDYAGSSGGMQGEDILGYAWHTEAGMVRMRFTVDTSWLEDMDAEGDPVGLRLYGQDGELLYEAYCDAGVGSFLQEADGTCFESYISSGDVDENSYLVNQLPANRDVAVYGIEAGWAGGSVYKGAEMLGYLTRYDDNTVGFTATSFDAFPVELGDPITSIRFTDEDGDTLYAAGSDQGVGEFYYTTRDAFCFRSTITEAAAGVPATVNDYVNVYSAPNLTSAVLGSMSSGFRVEVTQQTDVNGVLWGYIPDQGWVLMDQITLGQATDADGEDTAAATMAAAEPASIYEYPDVTSKILGTIDPADPVEVTKISDMAGTKWGFVADQGWVLMAQVPQAQLQDAGEAATSESQPDSTEPTVAEETPVTREAQEPDVPVPNGISDQVHTQDYWDSTTGQDMRVSYSTVPMPEYTMVVYLESDMSVYYPYHDLVMLVWSHRENLYTFVILCAALFVVLAVYLCCTAGRKPGTAEIHPAGFNVLPLDLYLLAGGCSIPGLFLIVDWATSDTLMQKNWEFCAGLGLCAGYVGCLIFVGFCFAFAAQVKTPGGYWWRNTLCVRILGLCRRLLRWLWSLVRRFFPWVGRSLGKAMGLVKAAFRWLWARLHGFLTLLPLTWQWLLAGAGMFLLLLLAVAEYGLSTWLCLAGCVAIVLYGARCFGILAESVKRMSQGDLDTQVEDPWMLGAFREFAQDLNGLAGVAVVAAQKQLKSERMKTELITNVSHDIKTPLTSIINYVDLLQKPHTEEEGAQYLEVLDRQSQRLKKLIEDLMEMSKASTGNMTVDAKPLDAAEAVNQALGEFADKLSAAQLTPVFRKPEGNVTMLADGRLTWRVLSNLLGNAVKYALPGTRLYIDLMVLEGKVVLSLKNISREELNMEAEELMERFVRGDSSRNTEGSGLGLNIARSLMELQKGSLQLLVDGDLFKVTLIFPEAR